jgi:hypothetical protein
LSVHSATLSADEAETFAVLVSSLSTDPRIADQAASDSATDVTLADPFDHFAVLDDPRDQRWVQHPAAVVLTLCAAAITHTDAAALDAAVGTWLAARADIDITIDTPDAPDPRPDPPPDPQVKQCCPAGNTERQPDRRAPRTRAPGRRLRATERRGRGPGPPDRAEARPPADLVQPVRHRRSSRPADTTLVW